MPLLEEIGIILGGIGDFAHQSRARGYEKKQEEFAKQIQSILSMSDPEQKEQAMRAFIGQHGGELSPSETNELKNAASQPNTLDAFVNTAMSQLETMRSSAPNPRSYGYLPGATGNTGRGGKTWHPDNVNPMEGRQFQTGLKDVYGMMGSKVYDAAETVAGNTMQEALLNFKTEVENNKNWKSSVVSTVDQVFSDDYLSSYLPEGLTKEEILSQLDNGNAVGLYYLSKASDQSFAVGMNLKATKDPRAKEMRDIKRQESFEDWDKRRKISLDDRIMMSKKSGKGSTKETSLMTFNVQKGRATVLKNLEDINTSIGTFSESVDGVLSNYNMSINDRSSVEAPLTDAALATDMYYVLRNSNDENYATDKAKYIQRYAETYEIPYAVAEDHVDIVEDKYSQIPPDEFTQVATGILSIQMAKRQGLEEVESFTLAATQTALNPSNTNMSVNVPEIGMARQKVAEEKQAILDGTKPKGNTDYKNAIDNLATVTTGIDNEWLKATLHMNQDTPFPTPPTTGGGFWEDVKGGATAGMFGNVTPPPSVETDTKNASLISTLSISSTLMPRVQRLATTIGNKDGKFSETEIALLISDPSIVAIAETVIPGWSKLTEEERRAILSGQTGSKGEKKK